jgi:hypothetical protein
MARQKTQDRLIALVPPATGRVTSAAEWQRMDHAERVELLTGRSLDNCKDILDFPLEAAVISPTLMNGKIGVIRAILTAITRVGLESSRLRAMQDELLQKIIDDFGGEAAGRNGAEKNGHAVR